MKTEKSFLIPLAFLAFSGLANSQEASAAGNPRCYTNRAWVLEARDSDGSLLPQYNSILFLPTIQGRTPETRVSIYYHDQPYATGTTGWTLLYDNLPEDQGLIWSYRNPGGDGVKSGFHTIGIVVSDFGVKTDSPQTSNDCRATFKFD